MKFKSLSNEKWKPAIITTNGIIYEPVNELKVSNLGRVIKIVKGKEEPILCKQTVMVGYYAITARCTDGKTRSMYVHRLVAMAFVKKATEEHTIVIHKNFEKLENEASNLDWMTLKKHYKYRTTTPLFKAVDRRFKANQKLTEESVALIKKLVNDPNRKTRMKMIAKQFGISEMQLYRIKNGTNWGYVKALE